jgi:PilZ domain-containing protein
MTAERRKHPRQKIKGLNVSINIIQPHAKSICIRGEIMDISFSGIKIKLHEAVAADIGDEISIKFALPTSGIPIAIKGTVKYRTAEEEYGLHYSDAPDGGSLEDLMFECVKYTAC